MAKQPKLGSGKRFEKLTHSLAGKGATDPKALAAWIGRKKFGAKKMAHLAAAGRKHAFAGALIEQMKSKKSK